MSLYQVQKLLFQMVNVSAVRARFDAERDALLREFDLTDEEARALREVDVGRLYAMGAHPLLILPFCGRQGLAWPQYLDALRKARDPGQES